MKAKSLLSALLMLVFALNNAAAQNRFNQIDSWLDEHTADMGGRSILVIYKDGKLVYTHSVNKMSLKQKIGARIIARQQNKKADFEDLDLSTRLPIASCSKWLSAALVMTFVDEGKLKLTDTVSKYLPVLSQHGKGGITISQCLSHLTGILSPELKESLSDMKNNNTMDDAIADIAAMPIEGKPGTVFRYSNTGLQIAGTILEKISGKSFEELFAERIAKPLNMQQTDFGHTKVALPAGGANSTPQDYINFLTMILNKGAFNGKKILSENSVAQMQTNRTTAGVKISYSPADGGTWGYGYGEWIIDSTTVSSLGLFGSFPWVNNDKRYAAFLMTFYIKNDGRQDRYKQLKQLVDEAVQ